MKTVAAWLMLGVVITAQAPVPAALKSAKTAYLVSAGLDQKFLDRLAKELELWKRFTLVDESKKADLVITIAAIDGDTVSTPIAGVIYSANVKNIVMVVKTLDGEQVCALDPIRWTV